VRLLRRTCLWSHGIAVSTIVLTAGCSTIATKPLTPHQEVVARSIVVEPTLSVEPSVAQHGSEITLTVKPVCQRRELLEVRTTTEMKNYNATPGTFNAELTAGLSLAVLGGLTVGFAQPLATKFASSTSVNPSSASPTPYYGIGGALLAGGVIAFVMAAVDAGRASGSEPAISTGAYPGQVLGLAPACLRTSVPPAATASILLSGETIQIGDTDARGMLVVDLARVIPERLLQGDLAQAPVC